jgi:RNA polymerase sigma factor (sigma-70 family)
MATGQLSEIVRHLRQAVLLRDGAGMTDGELLERFLTQHDGAALGALVRRHGPMVWGVCRRLLHNHHDAEDAFQATFLVLVRRAATVVPRERVANWLYGVAYQTALKARAAAARRREKERQALIMPEPEAVPRPETHDLRLLLDRELNGLPAKYRSAIVLCDLEGKSRREAAQHLGVPEGTLSSQLTRGRALLAKRLVRRGLAGSCGAAAVVSTGTVSARVPDSVLAATIQSATLLAAGDSAAGTIPAQVTFLMKGTLRTMLLNKFKMGAALALAVVLAGAGLCLLAQAGSAPVQTEPAAVARPTPAQAQPAQAAPQHNINLKNVSLDQVDGKAGTISVTVGGKTTRLKLTTDKGGELKVIGEIELQIVGDGTAKALKIKLQGNQKPSRLVDLPVAKDARIVRDGKQIKLADLKPGMRAAIELAVRDNQLVIVGISIRK